MISFLYRNDMFSNYKIAIALSAIDKLLILLYCLYIRILNTNNKERFNLKGGDMNFNSLDALDQEIIKILTDNSRASYVDISKKINLSRAATKSRIDSLEEKGIIEQYTIIVDPEKVGRTVSVFFDIQVEPKHFYHVAEELQKEECITDIYQMTGSSNLHVHAVMDNKEQLEKVLKEKLYELQGIMKIDTNMIVSRIKVRKGIRL